MIKHMLSLADAGADELACLVERALEFATGRGNGHQSLSDKIVGVYFRRPSTRTRSAFTVGALRLGAKTISYGPNDLQLVTGETIQDTTRVLSGYLDALVIRTNESVEEMRALAGQDRMAVVNAMSENEHPTQAIGDLSAIKEEFGRLDGIHLLYLGEGNNTAAALALAAARTPGMSMTFVTPAGYGLAEPVVRQSDRIAEQHNATIEHHHDIGRLPRNVDVVYTTRWQTCGESHSEANWQEKFLPYKVTSRVMNEVSKPAGTVFMHDLPAMRGEDVDDDVLDGPQSIAWRQAEHKMFSAMSVLEWCLDRAPVLAEA